MKLSEKIQALIERDYREKHMTQMAIAQKYSVSQQQIWAILCGKKHAYNLSVYSVEKMFPRMTFDLEGTSPIEANEPKPVDPFLAIVQASWSRMTVEERAAMAGQATLLAEAKTKRSPSATTSNIA